MYNRYIPQPDGSYKKNRMPDMAPPNPPHRRPKPQPEAECPPQPADPQPCPVPESPCEQPPRRTQHIKHNSIPDFFKQLLPQNIDTADLLIIVLLLLMCGDREEDKTNALLTLALYFFM